MLAHPANARHDPTHLDVRDHGATGKRLDEFQGPGRHHVTHHAQGMRRGMSGSSHPVGSGLSFLRTPPVVPLGPRHPRLRQSHT